MMDGPAHPSAPDAGEPPPDLLAAVAALADRDTVALELALPDAARELGLPPSALRRAVEAERRRRAAEHAEYEDAERRRADATPSDTPGDAPADPRGRPDLFVDMADLPDTAAELAEALAGVPHLFDRVVPVRIALDRQRGGMAAEPLTVHGVVNEAHAVRRPWRHRRTRDGELERQEVTLPERVAQLYLDRRGRWGLRPLDGIASAPLLHEDGTLRLAEGYDPQTRLWCERVPEVALPAEPAREEAAAALLRLRRHFRTFPFADAERAAEPGQPAPVVDTARPPGADESAFLAMLLAAVCRPSLPLAPGLAVRAPQYSGSGTGKGLLVRAICAVAFGVPPSAMTAGGTAEELEKRIAAALVQAGPVVFLDNVNDRTLKSDTLASAITERPAHVRPLGRTATVPVNAAAFVAVTGNALVLSEDLARRFVVAELDAGTEDAEAREFRGDLLADTLARRPGLLADTLTIWRWGRWMGGALPAGRPLGSFDTWGRWCRDPLLALGCRDPVLRVADTKARDPRRQSVAELFEAWWEAHRDRAVAVSDLDEGVRKAADPADRGRQYLASRIARLEGTRAAGFVLVRSPGGRWHADKYALRRTDEGEGHRQHRHHGGPGTADGACQGGHAGPMGPMVPVPPASAADDGGAESGFGWEGEL